MSDQPRVFAMHRLPAPVEARLNSRFTVEWNRDDGTVPIERVVDAARDADAIVSTVTDPVPAAVFQTRPRRLGIVANFGVGVERIDLVAAAQAGVRVTNTPGVLTECTADLTMALLLMTLRRAGEGERLVRAGAWTGWRPTQLLGRRATGRALGIVGMGRIGQAVARRAHHGFGMTIRYHARRPIDPAVASSLGAQWQPLDELVATADIVSLHCALTPETTGLIDRRRIGLMRPEAIVINTARGGLVDEDALAEAIASGRLAGAGLDVFQGEPAIHPRLRALENVVVLPHIGSATVETRVAMGMLVADNLEAFFEGRPLPSAVA